MKVLRLLLVPLVAITLAACGYDVQQAPKQTGGALAGAALGGLAGSQIGQGRGQLAAVGAGVLLGGLLGSELGKSLDRADQVHAAQTTNVALESNRTGQPSSWRNPDSGAYGTVTPTRTYQTAGRDCREFRHEIFVDGRTETVYGTACREPDGTWRTVSQ
ncbi:MAG TPA: RT0821/Lpp0805 family surface protein [Geminicoccaceae bacterium]|nr:RT0821/Lpp0805 family surface protein [Geminicoccaceae bacterium]